MKLIVNDDIQCWYRNDSALVRGLIGSVPNDGSEDLLTGIYRQCKEYGISITFVKDPEVPNDGYFVLELSDSQYFLYELQFADFMM